jgi:hypothetical protein
LDAHQKKVRPRRIGRHPLASDCSRISFYSLLFDSRRWQLGKRKEGGEEGAQGKREMGSGSLNVLCVTDQSISSNRRSFRPKVVTGKGIKENEGCEIKNDGKEGTGGIKERRRSRRDSGLRRVAVWAAGSFPRWFDTGCLDLI